MEIRKDLIYPLLIFDKEILYSEKIVLYPVKMKNFIEFQQYSSAITIPKNSIFTEKQLIKMSYFDFIKYAHNNQELAQKYKMPILPYCFVWILLLFQLVCGKEAKITYEKNLTIFINGEEISSEKFDDLRKLIILQNDIDFNINEFINRDTLNALEKAREFEAKKKKEQANIEDYIDSMVIALKLTEEYISNLSIRKFWRYVKRVNKYDNYTACVNGEMSGMVQFKEPISHWMSSLEVEDKYESLKVNEEELKDKAR